MAKRKLFVCFGDSLTQDGVQSPGWTNLLANSYQRKVDILNRGYSGYNSKWAAEIVHEVFDSIPIPDVVTLWFGANDSVEKGSPSKQHISTSEYEDYLSQIVKYLQTRGASRILVLSPPPVDHALWEDRKNELVSQYVEAAERVAEKHKVKFLNFFDILNAYRNTKGSDKPSEDYKQLLSDGLHFNAAGQDFVFVKVMDAIKTYWSELDPQNLPMDFPCWRDIAGCAKE